MTSEGEIPLLTLFSRQWCHLCHDMESALEALQQELRFDLEILDVDAFPDIEALYDEKVPVLVGGDKEICHHVLDRSAVRAYLLNFR